MHNQINIDSLIKVAEGLKPLLNDLVFVGGSIIEFYVNRPTALGVRPTMDIDCVIELTGYAEYVKLEEDLSKLGFKHDSESKVSCRYKYRGLTVDIMPTDKDILGFTNKWYLPGMQNSYEQKLNDDILIKLFKPPYFLASKFEAFKNRGGDRRTSHDFEDIIYFLDNRKDWHKEILSSQEEVRDFLIQEFSDLIADKYCREEISSHLPPTGRKDRLVRIMNEIEMLVKD